MAPALKLFTGLDEVEYSTPRELQRRYTLREAFEAVLLPVLRIKGRAKGTIDAYYSTIRWWERLTDDPAICEITDELLLRFHMSLPNELHGPRSRNKHTINVEAILRICGPRDSRNKRGRGILDVVPFCERAVIGAPQKRRRIVPEDAFAVIFDASSIATWPKHPTLPAPLVWRCLWLLLLTYGPRRTNAFLMPADSLLREPRHPVPEIEVSNSCGWLNYLPTKTRGARPQDLTLPLNETMRQWLDALGPRKNQLFPFPRSTRDWRSWSHRIQTAAGIAEPYSFQDFRKTCNVTWNRLSGRKALGRFVLGQMPRDVNTQFYEDFTADVATLVHSFPYPDLVRSGRLL